MRTLELSEVGQDLESYVSGLSDDAPIVLTKGGEAVAALCAVDDFELENWKLSQSPKFIEMLERSRRNGKEEGWISAEEVRRRFGVPRTPDRDSESSGEA